MCSTELEHTSILPPGFSLADLIELLDLADDLLVEAHDIAAANVLCSVPLEQQELVAYDGEPVEYVRLAGVLGHWELGSLHGGRWRRGRMVMVGLSGWASRGNQIGARVHVKNGGSAARGIGRRTGR